MPKEWNDRVLKLFAVLGEGNLRAVGGCVRDALLGLPVKDIDFATTHLPEEATTLLEEQGIAVKPTGLIHGTITALVDGARYEITTLRRDVETHGRRATVAYTKDWAEDAQRRDFTVNALYADAKGEVADPTGQSLDDLNARVLRFIGDAETRVAEDYLRVLRLFRFASQLPDFTIDDEALRAASRLKDHLRKLSRERVTSEWLKLLAGVHAREALAKASEAGLDSLYTYNKDAGALLAQLPRARWDALPHSLLLALAFRDGLPESFLLSNAEKRVYDWILTLGPSGMPWQEIAYRYGHEPAKQVVQWRHLVQGAEVPWDEIDGYEKPQFPLSAAHFQAQGLEGPALGKAFKEAEEAWIAETFAK